MSPDHDKNALSYLENRIAWGLAISERERWHSIGPNAVVDELVNPADHGLAARPAGLSGVEIDEGRAAQTTDASALGWMRAASVSARPLETFMEFVWMDWFGLSMQRVRPLSLMTGWLDLLARHALGNFSELLHEVTTNAAMLRFLDGASNRVGGSNENFARELLELFTVGIGQFDEADVAAASRALTGWVVDPDGNARFVPERHDQSTQVVLGADVTDVASIIETTLEPVTAARVVSRLGNRILGPNHNADLVPVEERFGNDWDIRAVVDTLLRLGIDGHAKPALMGPVAWLARAQKAAGTMAADSYTLRYFQSSGQIPLLPPNVNGFPAPRTWLSTSATIARFNLASHLAERSDRSIHNLGIEDLAVRLGIDRFGDPSTNALESCKGRARLAVALVTPEVLVA